MTDGSIRHQQCTLNVLWQVICLQARNNLFSNAAERAAQTTKTLITKKSALFLRVQTLTTSKSLCCAWSAEAAPPVLKGGDHWMWLHTPFGTREVCVAQEQWMELAAWATLLMSCLTPVESLQDFPQLGHNYPSSSTLKHALSGEGGKERKRDFFQAFWSQQQSTSLS